jgi:hypothetical protein
MTNPTVDPRVLDLLDATYIDRATPLDSDDSEGYTVIPVVRNDPKAESKARASKTTDDAATICGKSHDPRPSLAVAKLSAVGTLDARALLLALRRSANREESIQAIAGYVGYDRSKDFGAQELAARLKAQRELQARTVPTQSVSLGTTIAEHVVRASHPSTVAGMAVYRQSNLPDPIAKRIAYLKARERQVGESIADHEQAAGNEELDLAERHYHTQLALIDRARLATIREDIARLQNARR